MVKRPKQFQSLCLLLSEINANAYWEKKAVDISYFHYYEHVHFLQSILMHGKGLANIANIANKTIYTDRLGSIYVIFVL